VQLVTVFQEFKERSHAV